MKFAAIVHGTLGRQVDTLVFLGTRGFDLTKKVFQGKGEGVKEYFQAETKEEARRLRLSGMDSFFLAHQKVLARGTPYSTEETGVYA